MTLKWLTVVPFIHQSVEKVGGEFINIFRLLADHFPGESVEHRVQIGRDLHSVAQRLGIHRFVLRFLELKNPLEEKNPLWIKNALELLYSHGQFHRLNASTEPGRTVGPRRRLLVSTSPVAMATGNITARNMKQPRRVTHSYRCNTSMANYWY